MKDIHSRVKDIHLEVRDSPWRGIPSQAREHLFSPFLSSSLSRDMLYSKPQGVSSLPRSLCSNLISIWTPCLCGGSWDPSLSSNNSRNSRYLSGNFSKGDVRDFFFNAFSLSSMLAAKTVTEFSVLSFFAHRI